MSKHTLLLIVALCQLIAVTDMMAQNYPIAVAMYVDAGVSENGKTNVSNALSDTSRFELTRVIGADIRSGILANFDVIVFPGGSGSGQAGSLMEAGRDSVRSFIRKGGSYLGICGGAYLATFDYTWSLNILNVRVIDKKHWNRGTGPVDVRFNNFGRKLFELETDTVVIYYWQGPLMAPAGSETLPGYIEAGVFESEIVEKDAPVGVMKGTSAFVFSVYDEGRVAAFSPHPEITEEGSYTGENDYMVGNAIEWLVSDEPFLAFVSPREMENAIAGRTYNIEWISEGISDSVLLQFSVDNGLSWQPIESAAMKSYDWTIPNYLSGECLLRIESSSQPGLADTVRFNILAANLLQGSGTLDDPWQITNLTDLQTLSENSAFWNGNFIQVSDIDASPTSTWNDGDGFSPIGNTLHIFTGSYNGNGFTIDNLFINRSLSDYIGFFGYLEKVNIENIQLNNIDITGRINSGGLAGAADEGAIVTNCSVTGSISGSNATGGFIGRVEDRVLIDSCSADVSVQGAKSCGGFVGLNRNENDIDSEKPYISNSYATGNVTGTSRNTGSFVGWNTGLISKCYATGNVHDANGDDEQTRVGGFVGAVAHYSGSTGKIDNCYSKGNVTSASTSQSSTHGMGGFVGTYYSGGEIRNCYSTGTVQIVGSLSGGFCGRFPSGVSENNFWDTNTSGLSSSACATGKTSAEMTNATSINNIYLDAGWDFKGESHNGSEDIWNIGNERNAGYPYFDWQFPSDDPTLTGILDPGPHQPRKTELENAYPNPFNPETRITYHLAGKTDLSIEVFDLLGRFVKTLFHGNQVPGSYHINWNGTNENGFKVASGYYVIRMQTENSIQNKKVMLIK